MFQNLTKNLTNIFDKLKSRGALTESQINEAMRDIRVALLEADVALEVVKDFIEKVGDKAKGAEVVKSVSPGQMVVKIINDELINLLEANAEEKALNINVNPPANILLVGLQGSGKTSAASKLALYLKKQKKRTLLVSLDTYRPAAQEQLEILAKSIDVDSLEIMKGEMPLDIIKRAAKSAKAGSYEVVIYDSAGRLHIDEEMIDEVVKVKSFINASETLLVIDSMIGQDAVNIARHFNDKIGIDGVVLSRIDGDARGGAALSIKYIIGKAIKFLSTGEKPEEFELFDAKRIASRILDMGDVVSLVEKASEVIDQDEAEKTARRLQKGKFNLNDYISQLRMINKMGGLGGIMKMIPGIGKLTGKMGNMEAAEKTLKISESLYLSMTKKERKNPSILNASRKKRVAEGSGCSVQQVNNLIKQYDQISKMMKKAAKMDPKAMMRGMSNFFS